MLEPSKLLLSSLSLFVGSFILSMLLGDSFGSSQVIMGFFAGLSPISLYLLGERERLKDLSRKDELEALKANIQSLEAEISRINLALKLRN